MLTTDLFGTRVKIIISNYFLVQNFVGGLRDIKAAFRTGLNTQKFSFFKEDIVQTESIAMTVKFGLVKINPLCLFFKLF